MLIGSSLMDEAVLALQPSVPSPSRGLLLNHHLQDLPSSASLNSPTQVLQPSLHHFSLDPWTTHDRLLSLFLLFFHRGSAKPQWKSQPWGHIAALAGSPALGMKTSFPPVIYTSTFQCECVFYVGAYLNVALKISASREFSY